MSSFKTATQALSAKNSAGEPTPATSEDSAQPASSRTEKDAENAAQSSLDAATAGNDSTGAVAGVASASGGSKDSTNEGADKQSGKELLPNGIPKVVFDIKTPTAQRAGSEASGVHLDAADSHLDLQVDQKNPLKASCMHTGGFQYMWKGVRATHGVKGRGKYFFEIKVGPKPAKVVMPDTPANTQHVCRVGVSQPLTSLHLGDSVESWGFGGTGKKSTSGRFLDYGSPFGDGDVIGVVIDMDALTLAYTKNGQFLGVAFELPQRIRDTGLFPHVYVKNFDFQVNFKAKTKWFPPPGEEFAFVGDVKEQDLMANPVEHPKSVSECEFIMMCGLPACGKTYWAEKHMEKNAAKSFVLLGTNAVIDQMKVMGLKRQANYAARWEELMSTATEVFNSLVAYAGSGAVPRNIIIDQTNVFKRARSRKVQPFLAWGTRRCVVMVTDERTLQERTQKREREEGKMVPLSAVMDMKAAFALPSKDDGFNVIDYVEMPEAESRREIRRINEEGRTFKINNPGMNNRQPKPHIETRGPPAEADGFPAKKHRSDQWQPQQPWGSGPAQGERDWRGQGQQHAWGSAPHQAGWQHRQGAWNYRQEGNYSHGGGRSYGYAQDHSGRQAFDASYQGMPYGQRDAGGYNESQQYYGVGGSGYHKTQSGGYGSCNQGSGGQYWQQTYHDSRSQHPSSGGQWRGSYGNPRGGVPHSGNSYQGGY